MNKIFSKFFLAEENFTSELHLRQPRIAYSACRKFAKHRERIQKFRERGNLNLYRNELDKACFAQDLAKRTISDNLLEDKGYGIAKNPKYDRYQRGFASMVHKFFDKKTGLGASVNEEIAEELHKLMIKNLKRRRVYTKFKDNIWAADLAKMVSLSSFNHAVKYFVCAMEVFTKYALDKPLKDKKGKTILHGFIEIVNESKHKPNKLWVDQGR